MSNEQKLPLARTLPRAIHNQVNDAFQREGQALPCSVVSVAGAIVTVKFEVNSAFTLPNVTVPLAGAEYIRYPIQKGDKGYVIPADARLAGMSGIGGGVSDLSQPANLTALVFFPFANAKWSNVDSQAVTIYGPNGVALRDSQNKSNITLIPSGIAVSTDTFTVNANSSANIASSGTTSISGNTSVTVSSSGMASMSGATVSTSGQSANTVAAPFVMLGVGSAGNLATLPPAQETLFSSVVSGGTGSILSNPVAPSLSTLSSSITACAGGLDSVPGLTPTDITALTSALTGPSGLSAATTNLTTHTNLLSGVGSPTTNVPSLTGVIGVAGGLDHVAGGAFGSSSAVVPTMTTGLNAAPTVGSINTYVNGIIPGLTNMTLTVPGVLGTLGTGTSSLNGYVTNDTAAYSGAQSNLMGASSFLGVVGAAQNPTPAVQSLMTTVTPPATLTTLKSVMTGV